MFCNLCLFDNNKKLAPRKKDTFEHLENACREIGPWAAVQERIQHNWQQNNDNPEENGLEE
jgi:hypothetical protein